MAIEYPVIVQLCHLLDNQDFPSRLYTAYKATAIDHDGPLFLNVEASVGSSTGPASDRILLVLASVSMHKLLLILSRVV